MDEIALGGLYWTVLSRNDPGFDGTLGQRVIGLCRGRMVTDLLPPLRTVASWYREWQPASPRPSRITSDMWDAFWTAARSPDVFGNLVLFSTDPFHLQRHVHLAWEAAEETCIACCSDDARCPRYRYNEEVNALLNSIWEVSDNDQWEAFKLRWSTLRSRPGTEDWREPYARFDRMFNAGVAGSRLNILEQTFGTAHDGARPSNARAESANARIREVMKHLRFRSADGRLGRIMEQLHATPTIPELKSVLLPPVLLRCPVCAGRATLPPRTTWRAVVTLPRGVTPLALQAPARLVCPTCDIQTAPDPGPVTPEFIAWLRDPLQGQLNGVTLRRLTGLSARQLMEVRGRVNVPETPRSQRVAIYDEIWTSHRVWLVLATPEGELLDLQLLEEPARPEDSRSGYRPDLHAKVAQAGVNLLLQHEPSEGYRQVQIRQEYAQLSRALKQVDWLDTKAEEWEGRSPFSLSPYAAHNLPTRAFKAALKYLRSEGVVGRAVRDAVPLKNLFKAEPSGWEDHDLWNTLSRDHPQIASLLQEANDLKGLLLRGSHKTKKDDASAWKELLKLESQLEAFYLRGPTKTGRKLTEEEQVRVGQWAAWRAVKWVIFSTLLFPTVAAGRHPHLISDIKRLLRNSPNLQPDQQRARILAYIAADRQMRAARPPKRRRKRKAAQNTPDPS